MSAFDKTKYSFSNKKPHRKLQLGHHARKAVLIAAILVTLLALLFLTVHDQIEKFIAGNTSLALNMEHHETLTPPAMTFCIDKGLIMAANKEEQVVSPVLFT